MGHASGESGTFPPGAISGGGGHDRSITSFYLMECSGLRLDLEWLADAVATGRLDPQVSWRGSWTDAADAVAALRERRLHGKAVLEID